jgi:plastocyanin
MISSFQLGLLISPWWREFINGIGDNTMMFKNLAFAVLVALGSSAHAAVPNYAECTEQDFVDSRDAQVTVEFQGSSYTPACLKVKRGTQITIPASAKHPLQAASDFDGVANPIRSEGGDRSTDFTFTADVLGFFGYYCTGALGAHFSK